MLQSKIPISVSIGLAACIVLALTLPGNVKHASAVATITISTANEELVNSLLFGADAPNWRDCDPWDTALTNKIVSIAPAIMMTPENGIRCNYTHWKNPRGYGFDSSELTKLKEQGIGGPPLCLKDMFFASYQQRNYTDCYYHLNSVLKIPTIYGANIVTGTIDETTDYVKKYHPAIVLLGVELFLPSIKELFPAAKDFTTKAKPFALAIRKVDPSAKIMIQVPYYGGVGQIKMKLRSSEWVNALQSDTSWYDYVVAYNWSYIAGNVNAQQPLETIFNAAKEGETDFFNSLSGLFGYYRQNFPSKKIIIEQWGINDSKSSNNGSIFGNTMLFALHIGRYYAWLAANQNNAVKAAIFGGYLANSYPPTTAIYAPRDPGRSLHSTYYETTVSIALRMMSDAFHGNSTIENTTVADATDLYAQSFQKNGKHYLYVENFSNLPRPLKITINSTTTTGSATEEELHGAQLYSSVGWTLWEKTYSFEKTAPSEVEHDTKTENLNSISIPPYSLTKIIF